MVPTKHCCALMDLLLDNIRVPILYLPVSREYALLMLEDGRKRGRMNAVQRITYCPWCNKKLSESLRDKWFEILEKKTVSMTLIAKNKKN